MTPFTSLLFWCALTIVAVLACWALGEGYDSARRALNIRRGRKFAEQQEREWRDTQGVRLVAGQAARAIQAREGGRSSEAVRISASRSS